jgi:protein TIF31
VPEGQHAKEEAKLNPYEEKLKKSYEDFMAIIEKESKKEIILPQSAAGASVLKELFRNPIEKEMNKVKHVKCVESIQFSTFNPVPPYRRLQGDLFYLTVKSLDHGDFGITCCVNGFYRNDNIEKQQFSPIPSTKHSPCFSYTLVGCLYQLSPTFGKNLEQYLQSILNTEPYFLT